jgi:hypothetical protein
MTFTATGEDYTQIAVSGYSHTATTGCIDGSTGANTTTATSINSGTVTPTQNNDVCVAMGTDELSYVGETALSFASPSVAFTSITTILTVSATHEALADGYYIETTATPISTTYTSNATSNSGGNVLAAVACFKHS